MADTYLFTSESVSEGHPDKVCDQISDAVLDTIITKEPRARVACETLVKNNLVVLGGEITTNVVVDFDRVAREVIERIGYTGEMGFDPGTATVLAVIGKQSPDIAQGVDEGKGLDLEQGAGDQGLMYGYACDETSQLMPLPIYYAHRLMERHAELRKDGRLPWLRPDAKSQVSVRYVENRPPHVETIVRGGGEPRSDEAVVRDAMRANVRASVDHLRHGSRLLEDLVLQGRVAVTGAEYDLATGAVRFFETIPER